MGATAASRRALIIDEEAAIRALARLHLARCRMRRVDEPSLFNPPIHANGTLTVIQEGGSPVLNVHGALQAPLNGELEFQVRALLDRGERVIVLDLARTDSVDAAGVGELVGAYNTAIAAGGALLVVHPPTRVGQLLARVGLLDILCRG